MRGKTIRQFLIDGQADGRWATELSNWTGKAYKIPRTHVHQCTDRDDLSNTGVYFLFGRNDETDEEQVYIGEAENIFNRLKQHLSEKDFWTECIVFISKDNNLNKAHIKYLENHLYILAKEFKRYEVVNSNVPAEASISEMDRAEMDEFIDNMRLILGVLGHKILEPSIKRKSDEKEILYISQDRSGIKASGKPISEGFAVLKGSKVADNVATSLSKSVINKRQLLFDKGIIDGNFTFTQDWAFTSPSLAAAIVVGYSINGRHAWKNKKGISLKEIEER
jgi:hypothetical protein